LEQAKNLGRNSSPQGSRSRVSRAWGDGRGESLTSLLNRAMETVFLRYRLEQAEFGLESLKEGANLEEAQALEVFEKLVPIGKQDIRSRFPEGVLTKDTQDGRTYRSTSGTSGERLTVVTNFARRESGRASALHVLEVATGKSLGMSITDIPPNVCNSICGLEGPPETSILRHIWKGISRRNWSSEKFRTDLNGLFERRLMYKQDILAPLDARSPSDLAKQLKNTWGLMDSGRPYLLRAFPQYLLWLSEFQAKRSEGCGYLKYVMHACD